MGSFSGPNLAKTGITFNYDMGNTLKSWKGAPVTNQFAVPTPAANGDVTFAAQGTGIFKRIYSGTFDGYSITNNDVVYRYDLNATAGCYYHGNTITLGAGQYITFTFDYYISPDAQNYPTVNYLGNVEGSVGGFATDPTPTIKGVWKTATIASGVTSAGNYNLLLYPGACNPSYLASSGFILYRNPQAVVGSISNFRPPFVGPSGTRSSTQALLDPIRRNTITASSLTYAADGSASFNGSTDFITIPNTTLGNGDLPWTVSAWVKTTTNASTLGTGPILSNQSGGPVYSAMCVNSGKIAYWTYQNSAWTQKLGVGTTVNDGTWHLLTWVNNSNYTMDMYVDGVLDSNVPNSTSGNQNPVDVIGRSWASYFVGSIDAVSIYNGKALTPSEVRQNFVATRGRYGV